MVTILVIIGKHSFWTSIGTSKSGSGRFAPARTERSQELMFSIERLPVGQRLSDF